MGIRYSSKLEYRFDGTCGAVQGQSPILDLGKLLLLPKARNPHYWKLWEPAFLQMAPRKSPALRCRSLWYVQFFAEMSKPQTNGLEGSILDTEFVFEVFHGSTTSPNDVGAVAVLDGRKY